MTATTTIDVDRFTDELLVVLTEAFENSETTLFLDEENAYRETLSTISAAQASRPVSDTCASIATQVNHVLFFLDLALKAARDEPAGRADWAGSWTPTSVTEDEWAAMRERLNASYEEVRETLRTYQSWDRPGVITGIIGMVAHSAYHLGQIRQALCTIRE